MRCTGRTVAVALAVAALALGTLVATPRVAAAAPLTFTAIANDYTTCTGHLLVDNLILWESGLPDETRGLGIVWCAGNSTVSATVRIHLRNPTGVTMEDRTCGGSVPLTSFWCATSRFDKHPVPHGLYEARGTFTLTLLTPPNNLTRVWTSAGPGCAYTPGASTQVTCNLEAYNW